MAKAKKINTKPVDNKKDTVLVYSAKPVKVDFNQPGFSNVAPDSPQAKPYKRSEVLPSQVAKD